MLSISGSWNLPMSNGYFIAGTLVGDCCFQRLCVHWATMEKQRELWLWINDTEKSMALLSCPTEERKDWLLYPKNKQNGVGRHGRSNMLILLVLPHLSLGCQTGMGDVYNVVIYTVRFEGWWDPDPNHHSDYNCDPSLNLSGYPQHRHL